MTTTIVWRVETRAVDPIRAGFHRHQGAFGETGAALAYSVAVRADRRANPFDPHEHPGPRDEVFASSLDSGRHVFGMRSRRQLLAWFPSKVGRRQMGRFHGMAVRVYRVPTEDVLQGFMQTAFDPRRAEAIETRNITTLKLEAN